MSKCCGHRSEQVMSWENKILGKVEVGAHITAEIRRILLGIR